ncbi:MAG: hypothetical protein WCO12_00215 [bacterium]
MKQTQIVQFVVDKDIDIANYYIGINSYKRIKAQGFSQYKNENLEKFSELSEIEVQAEIEKRIERYYSQEEKLLSLAEDINNEWMKIEEEFIERLEKVHKFPFSEQSIKGVLSSAGRFGYNTQEKWFATDMFRNKYACMDVAMHELMHFMFHKYYDRICEEEGLTKNEMWDVKESFTVLLNLEFGDLSFQPDNGYLQHVKLREVIKESWEKNHDFDIALEEVIEYVKMNRVGGV